MSRKQNGVKGIVIIKNVTEIIEEILIQNYLRTQYNEIYKGKNISSTYITYMQCMGSGMILYTIATGKE